eukprot:s63_g3.t3
MAERTNHTCCLPGYFNARLSFLWPGPARAEEVMFGKDYSEISGSDRDEEITWIEWFCHLKGNEFFVEDDFNLTGLSAQVPCYEDALNMILDFDDQDDHRLQDDQQPLALRPRRVETAAQMLYGLIHARFILTSRGMAAMLDKYNCYVYGKCPLTQCPLLSFRVRNGFKTFRGGQWPFALHLFTDFGADVQSCSAAISACTSASAWSAALRLFADMPSFTILANAVAFSTALSACGAAAAWQRALQLLVGMAEARVQQDVVSCSTAISACERASQWQMGLHLFQAMANDRVHQNLISYSVAIVACARGGRWRHAQHLLAQLSLEGHCPDSACLNAAISSCDRDGCWEQALHWFAAMPRYQLRPDICSYGATISACAKAAEWQVACALLGPLKQAELGPDLVTYGAAIASCEKVGQWPTALYLFVSMQTHQVIPDLSTSSSTLKALKKGSQWREAMNQAVLPIGTSDMLRQSAAKVYCPHCREIYFPKSSKLECLDGAYFGTTFAHLFFLTYQQLVPPTMPQPHCPRIYGFKIHKSVKENLRRQNERAQKQLPGQFFVTGPTAVFGKELGSGQQALERRSWWTDNVGTEITAAEFSVVPAIQSTECAVQVTLGRADVDFQARGCQASPSLAEDAFSSFFRPFAPYGPPLRALCVGRLEFEPSSEEVHRGPGGARQGFAQGACLSAPRDTQGGPVEMRDEAI